MKFKIHDVIYIPNRYIFVSIQDIVGFVYKVYFYSFNPVERLVYRNRDVYELLYEHSISISDAELVKSNVYTSQVISCCEEYKRNLIFK